MIHELPLEQRTLHGHFSRELEPVLTVDPGDSVQVDVPNAGWELESGEQFVSRDLSVLAARIPRLPPGQLSDHRPVIVRLRVKPPPVRK